MQKMYTPSRFVMIFAALALAFAVYVFVLYIIQVYNPRHHSEEQIQTRASTRVTTIAAARGNIYDRNGILLASGRQSYRLMIDWFLVRGDSARANEDILNLIYAAMDADIVHTDTFPVTRGAPFEFVTNMTNSQRSRLDAYFAFHNIDPDISVSDLLAWMRTHYNIDYTVGILDARLIIGVRYELEIRRIVGTISSYVFAEDVSTEFVAYVRERGFLSVFPESTFIREYHTTAAPHLLGYVGPMTAEEFEVFREYPWELPMNAIVGKMGAERAFENFLHGREGERRIEIGADGTVLREVITRDPEPGLHVHLTIDLGLQIASENALRSFIEMVNAERTEAASLADETEELELIPGGAVVVVNLNTGELLAAASYPTFNLTTLSQDWAMLNTDMRNPMLNRATHGQFIPGSSFKMVTGFAGLRHIHDVGRWTPITCRGRYDRWVDVGDGFVLHCAIFSMVGATHGELDIVRALAVSCNYYFLWMSDNIPGGAEVTGDILAETALEFGLGAATGLEIPENPGRLATPALVRGIREAQGEEHAGYWFADVLLTGFGQGENRFTPVQLANYAATIGNGGTLYNLSLLSRVQRADFTGEPIFVHEPVVRSVIAESEYIAILQEGMLAAAGPGGTARSIFEDYPIAVASKTGTAQIEGRGMNEGIFVAYAPADNPQIAIAVVVEKGGGGAAVMPIARMVFDHFFATSGTFLATPYGQLVP